MPHPASCTRCGVIVPWADWDAEMEHDGVCGDCREQDHADRLLGRAIRELTASGHGDDLPVLIEKLVKEFLSNE